MSLHISRKTNPGAITTGCFLLSLSRKMKKSTFRKISYVFVDARRASQRRAAMIFLVLASLLGTACDRSSQTAAPGQKTAASDPAAPQPPKVEKKGAFECLTTPNGIPLKVIVKSDKAFAYENYDFTGDRKQLKFFGKYFIFKQQPTGYLVGEATVRDSTVGWVRSEEVIPWNHEQALFFINKGASGRAPVKIWMDRNEIGKSNAPHFEEDLSAGETTEPFPILQKDASAVQLAFLWGMHGKSPASTVSGLDVGNAQTLPGERVVREGDASKTVTSGGSASQQAQTGLRRMDVVLVIDVTSSMGPYMQAVREKMTRIVDRLTSIPSTDFPVDVHIGVVAYRDYADARSSFVTRRLDLTPDRAAVTRFLSGLSPTSVGKDKYEAVFEGLSDALEHIKWGTYSHKVMILVGDAPPQGYAPAATPEPGAECTSRFCRGSFDENVSLLKSLIQEKGIRFYALGVGNDPEMRESFRRIVEPSTPGGFRALTSADVFVTELESELRKQREIQGTTGKVISDALQQSKDGKALSKTVLEALAARNLSPERLSELAHNRIQKGWFDVSNVQDNVSVSVYVRRRDLEAMLLELRDSTREGLTDQELRVLTSILEPHVGKEGLRHVKSINDLVKLVSDLPIPPEVVRQIASKYDDNDMTRVLRTKMNNIMILLLQKQLFNNYEEGWIPIEYLPGSMSRQK